MATPESGGGARGGGGAPALAISNAPPVYASVAALGDGHFGEFGGRFVPETLVAAHEELERAYVAASADAGFRAELERLGRDFVGRPTPLYHAARLTAAAGGAQIWLKREELAHTGSHKINNALGQALLARRIGKTRIIAETGAGQHGVASATACALLGLECVVYMGEEDVQRQALNVFRMRMLGARVVPVTSGSKTLKDAINEAMRDWVTNVKTTHYIIGTATGPHPFPTIVRDFQAVIGREARAQMLERTGRLPDVVIACVGGGSNAIGLFSGFMDDAGVKFVGVEAGGAGVATAKHAATLTAGSVGVLHGTKTVLLQDAHGQVTETHSISAGLDYPGVGPQHAHLQKTGRATYVPVTDAEALAALQLVSHTEGIIPALEPAHALSHAMAVAARLPADAIVLVNMCGRGDKDMASVAAALGEAAAAAAAAPPPPAAQH